VSQIVRNEQQQEKTPRAAISRTVRPTAASILGQQSTVKNEKEWDFKVKPEWAKFYQRLLELRDQLIRQ